MKKTFFQVDFINFTHNDGDYFICKTIDEVGNILNDVEHILDSDPTEIERPYSVIIKPIIMTDAEYDKWLTETYED